MRFPDCNDLFVHAPVPKSNKTWTTSSHHISDREAGKCYAFSYKIRRISCLEWSTGQFPIEHMLHFLKWSIMEHGAPIPALPNPALWIMPNDVGE